MENIKMNCDLEGDGAKRPCIRIKVRQPGNDAPNWVRLEERRALISTGSAMCTINPSLLEGGPFLRGSTIDLAVYLAQTEIEIDVRFLVGVPDLYKPYDIVLGRDFLRHGTLTIGRDACNLVIDGIVR